MPNPDGSKTPEELQAEQDARAKALEQRFAAIENGMKLIAEATTSQQTALSQIVEKLEAVGQNRSTSNSNDPDPDLETMDRKDFAAYLMSQLKSTLEEGLKPVKDSQKTLDEKIDAQGLTAMIKDFQKDNPDFFEWKEEMQGLLKHHPTLTPARAYALARAEADPDKVKKIDEKYGLGKPKDSGGEGKFLGLFPGQSSSSATKGAGRMSPNQAAEAAWNSVMSSIGQSVN